MAKVQPPKDSDIFPPVDIDEPAPRPPVKVKAPSPPPSALRVTACELQTAPDHALVVRLSGETDELAELRRKIMRALHPDDGSEPGVLPRELEATLPGS